MDYNSLAHEVRNILSADEAGKSSDCYYRYLNCMSKLCDILVSCNSEDGVDDLPRDALDRQYKLLNLAKLCLERSVDIVSEKRGSLDRNLVQQSSGFSDSSSKPMDLFIQPAASHCDSSPMIPLVMPKSPMQFAVERNRALMNDFSRRTQRMKPNDPNKVNLELNLHRKIHENLVIARKRQNLYEVSLQNDIADRVRTCDAIYLRYPLVFSFSDSNDAFNFLTSSMSRILFRQSVIFEYQFLLKDVWYQNTASSTSSRLKYLLSRSEHPLSQYLSNLKQNVMGSVASCCSSENIDIADAVLEAPSLSSLDSQEVDDLSSLGKSFCEAFKRLSSLVCLICNSKLQSVRMDDSWKCLSAVFFSEHFHNFVLDKIGFQNVPFISKLDAFMRHSPRSETLTLCGVPDDIAEQHFLLHSPFLEKALNDLKSIGARFCPMDKAQCLTDILNVLVSLPVHGEDEAMSADSLMPLLCGFLTVSNFPHVLAHLRYIDYFLHELSLQGAEGYAVTSFHGAMNYLLFQDLGQFQK